MRKHAAFVLALAAVPLVAADLSPQEIIRRACERENRNVDARRQYTYRESEWQKLSNQDGSKTKKEERAVRDVFYIGGEEFKRLIEKNWIAISGKEAEKEQARLDKAIRKWKDESPESIRKREAKEIRQEKEFRDQIQLAFNFTLVGEEEVNSRRCYRLHAEPRADYKPKGEGKILAKLKGDIWIDQENYQWARVEAETVDTLTFMAGLFRLAKGSTLNVRQTFVNNEVWFPDLLQVKANARAMLFMAGAVEWEARFSDFKKYSVDSTVVVSDQ